MEGLDESNLPSDILDKIRELELELNEGDITEKGFLKKKKLILLQYSKEKQASEKLSENSDSNATGVSKRKDGRKYTRDESRYRSEVREEQVREALARHRGQEALVPSKRKDHSGNNMLPGCGAGETSAINTGNQLLGSTNVSMGISPSSKSNVLNQNRDIFGLSSLINKEVPNTNGASNFHKLQEQDSDSEDDDEDDDNATNATSSDGSNRHRQSNKNMNIASASSLTQIASSHKSPRVSRKEASSNSTSVISNVPKPQPRTKIGLNSQNNNNSSDSSSRSNKYQTGSHGAPPDVTSHIQQNIGMTDQQNPLYIQQNKHLSSSSLASGGINNNGSTRVSQLPRTTFSNEYQQPVTTGSMSSLQNTSSNLITGATPPTTISASNITNNNSNTGPAHSISGSGLATATSINSGSTPIVTGTTSSGGGNSGGGGSGGPIENGLVSSRVSEKIQQLVQTLKRPKRKPLPEYFQEDDDAAIPEPVTDPNTPKPKGTIIEPAVGESIKMFSGLPRSLECALENYSQAHGKQPVMTCIDSNGRHSGTVLSYAKLYQKATRIAYLLLNKVGHRGEQSLKPRDRVALVFSNNDPTNLICAFYGCILAGVVPVCIEVPLARRDASCQSMGFLLSSQEVRVVLTSEQCYKSLPRSQSGEIEALVGWPRVQWINIDHHASSKPTRDWRLPERLSDSENLYIEYSYSPIDGSVRGVCVSREAAIEHCRTLASVCQYAEGETLVCVSELKRETGLWHGLLTAVLTGMHVVFVPYALLKVDPAVWLKQITKLRASAAIVKSRDMHWALLAERDHASVNLSSLRMLLVSDGSNPWSLNTCDNFLTAFRARGLRSDALCPCAGSSETLTLSIRRPLLSTNNENMRSSQDTTGGVVTTQTNEGGGSSPTTGGRGILSMHSLSFGLVRVDLENSLTSLTLQDCGQILPGGKAVVIKPNGSPYLCHTDEVGEVCLQASYTGSGYSRLQGQTNAYFKVQPLDANDNPCEPNGPGYVRSGLLGFLGPAKSGGLLFICGSVQGLMTISGRRHNADDIIATVLAVEPMRLVFRGRIAVFSIPLLRDERIVIVAELRVNYNEEAAFKWMSRVIQAVDSIHQVPVYSIALVPQNRLPKTPLGGVHIVDAKRRFLEGRLGACNVLLCPHTAITNLPQAREPNVLVGQVGPSAMMVGHLVQGARLGLAQGRPGTTGSHMSSLNNSDNTNWIPLSHMLHDRANSTPKTKLLVQLGPKLQEQSMLTCERLQQRAERIASVLAEKRQLPQGTPVLIALPPSTDLVCAVFGCFLAGCIPIPVRPPTPAYCSGPLAPATGILANTGGTTGSNSGSQGGSGSISGGGSATHSTAHTNATSTISSNASQFLANSAASTTEAIITTVEFIRQVMQATKCTTVITCMSVLKALRARDIAPKIQLGEWQKVIDTDDLPKRRLAAQDFHRPQSLDEPAYIDFSCSPGAGNPVGATISHAALLQICHAQKLQCEFYPSREVVLSLDPYSGLGFTLWCLSGVYCGHLSYLVPPHLLDTQPDLWLAACSVKQVRDTFCSYNTVEISTRCLANSIPLLRQRGIQLNCLRSLVIVAEERPRVQTTNNFCKLFSVLGLNSRAVSTSFGCRVNLAMCLQGPSSPDTSSVYVDQISLRNDRVKLLEKGSPHSLCLLESGKLLPGVKIAIAHTDTQGQCADSHLGEIWVSSNFNSSNIITCGAGSSINDPAGGVIVSKDQLCKKLASGDTEGTYARTGYLGFVRRTELTQSDGERHDALFVVGALENTIMLRGMRYHPIDIECTVIRCHKSKIAECVVFTWSNLLVVVVELNGEDWEAVDLVHLVTAAVLEDHYLIVGVVVVVDRGTIHVNSRGEKERVLLRELFVNDKLDPMYVSYNM